MFAGTNSFTGPPWVKPTVTQGRIGTAQSSTCQIWTFGSLPVDFAIWKFKETVVYEKNKTGLFIHPDWAEKIKVSEIETDRFLEIHLTVLKLNFETQGIYTCETEKSSQNNQVDMRLITDASWTEWGQWSSCSKSCMKEGGELGYETRSRTCNLPQNGGIPCKESDATEQRSCSPPFCSINHVLGMWSEWGDCSTACGDGITIRSRNCTEGRNGGTQCPELEERKKCHKKSCPECKLYEWTPWSVCSISCRDSSDMFQVFGTKKRTRKYDEVDPSNPRCDKTSMTETDKCAGDESGRIIFCPVDAAWSKWSEWTQCSVTCGQGSQKKRRTCKEQRFGGITCDKLLGKGEEVRDCQGKSGPCPTDCKLSAWSSWSTCSQNCGVGIQHKTRSVLQEPNSDGAKCGDLELSRACTLKVHSEFVCKKTNKRF